MPSHAMNDMRTLAALFAFVVLLAPRVAAQSNFDATATSEFATPQRWVRIGITDADTLWYDPETVRNPEPGVYTVWVLESRGRGETLPTGERYSLVRELSDFDCAERRSRRRELVFMTTDEALVKAYRWAEADLEWHDPVPASDVEFILREVCERVQ